MWIFSIRTPGVDREKSRTRPIRRRDRPLSRQGGPTRPFRHLFQWFLLQEVGAGHLPEMCRCHPPRHRSSCASSDSSPRRRRADPQGGGCAWRRPGENVNDGISGLQLVPVWTAWTGSAAVAVRGVLGRGFLGKVLVCVAVRRAGCSCVRRPAPWKRSRTMFEALRAREPVNNGRRNKGIFSREQVGSVLDASAQETSTGLATPTKVWLRPRRRNGTAPLLQHHPCGSRSRLAANNACGAVQMGSGPFIEAPFFFENLEEDRCEYAVAEGNLDYCQKCMQRDQVLERKNEELLGNVRV